MTFAAVGSFVQTSTTTLAVNPSRVGNFYLAEVISFTNTVYASSISGGNCTWTQVGSKFAGSNKADYATVFLGKATATGAANATIAFSGSTPSFECVAQQFSSTVGSWAQDGLQGTLDLVTGTANSASLTPGGSGELYFGFFYDSGTAVGGSTPGYTYDVTAGGNGLTFNPNCGGVQAPVWGDTGIAFGVAVLLRETPAGPSSKAVQVRQPRKQFGKGLLYSSPVPPSSTRTSATSSQYSTGLISASYGAPPLLGSPGPVFHPLVAPARAQNPLPKRGRVYSNPGGPVHNPLAGPVFRQRTSPARAPIPENAPRGRVASAKGAPVHNPLAGAVFHSAPFPRRVHPTLPRRGRTRSNPGGPVSNPPPPPPPAPNPLPTPSSLPNFNAAPGWMLPGMIFPGEPVNLGVRYIYTGNYPVYYLDYLDGDMRHTLHAIPGGNYRMLVANTRRGLTIPPPDGNWLADNPAEDEMPLHRKLFLKMREHIHKSRRRSGYRGSK